MEKKQGDKYLQVSLGTKNYFSIRSKFSPVPLLALGGRGGRKGRDAS
jgi:hypothetical protein